MTRAQFVEKRRQELKLATATNADAALPAVRAENSGNTHKASLPSKKENTAAMSNSLTPVQFYDDTIFYIEKDGEKFIPMKPVVENMGLAWQPQAEKLKNGASRWGVTMIVIPSAGGEQETMCLPFRKLAGFLATINPNKVAPELREKIIRYQNECDDVLHEYWTKGRAPAVPQDYLSALEALIESERAKQRALALVEEQKAIIDQQEIKLGDNANWKAVTAIPWLQEYFKDTSTKTLARIEKMLSRMSKEAGTERKKIEDQRWGSVYGYHISIIDAFFDKISEIPEFLGDIRK